MVSATLRDMPMKSKAQRRALWAKDPEVAQEFEDETPKGKLLPEKVKPKKKGRDVRAFAKKYAKKG